MSVARDSTILLSCRKLNSWYQEVQVLHDISLRFKKGEFVALLGKNGAGKTTLLSCLVGILPSISEQLDIGGLNPVKTPRSQIARKVSYVPQEHDDIFPFSVLEVVVMGRTAFLGPFGAPSEDDYALASDVLDELYISHLRERVFNTLSGGEKQMVLLARALVQTRTLIFLDEPTNHLDYKNRYQILSSLKKQCVKNDSCVVACLHDPNHATIFADRVVLLGEGKIIAEGKTVEVMTGEAMSRLYGLAVSSKGKSIEPCFCQPSFAGKVLLLVGASGEGKTTTLQKIVSANKEKNIGGIICPGTWKNNRRYNSTVSSLSTGEDTLFAQRSEANGDGPFVFYAKGQELADTALRAEQYHQADCVIVDEIGPLELRDGGHASHLSPLLSLRKPKHIWSVRPSIVDHVCSKWMLVNPVIVEVKESGAVEHIQNFLDAESEYMEEK